MDEALRPVDPKKGIDSSRSDSTRRFSDRVENYVKYRPGYPWEVLAHLRDVAGLTPESTVADIGSGTGISSRPFLEHGCVVFGIEPNPPMRQAAETLLSGFAKFHSVDGTAEFTTLPGGSVDLVAAGQAFHWFKPLAAKAEFRRVLRPNGKVALMWNCRKTTSTLFLQAYEQLLLDFATDYQAVRHENIDSRALTEFFGDGNYSLATFANQQSFDFPGLCGRLLSSSYAPVPGQPRHDPMMRALRDLFERYNREGRVSLDYDTQVYVGGIGAN
jgi:SAM-dependent methyltransferase